MQRVAAGRFMNKQNRTMRISLKNSRFENKLRRKFCDIEG
jgi:hypothetical protein